MKSPYENADFYIEHLFSFLLHNPDLFFISFQNFSFANKHYSFFLYNYYENYGILDNVSGYIYFDWNTFLTQNTVFRSIGLGAWSGKYNLLLKTSSQSLSSTLRELFLDDEFLMHAENDLSLLKSMYVNFHDKLSSKSQIIDIYEKYYNAFSAYTHCEEEISLYYDWTQDSPRDPPEDKMILFANLKSKNLLNDKMLKYFVDLVFSTHNPDHFLQLRNRFSQFFHSEITNFLSFEEIEFLFWLNAFSFSKFQNKFLNTIDGLFYRIQNPYFFKNVMKPEPVLNDLTKIKDYLNETISLIDFLISNLFFLLKESIDNILPDLEYFYIDQIVHFLSPRPNLPVLDDLVMLFDNHPRFKFLHIELSCIVQLLPSASDYLRTKNILFLHTKSEYLKHELIITKEGQCLPNQSLSIVDYWKLDVLASFENYVTVRKNDQELTNHIRDLLKDIKDPRFSTLHKEEQRINEICSKEIETILRRKKFSE